ncbi:hypothetical protein BDF14DRAFT_1817058 [Spinellus fusiger]|nr:hypothetical protein BDF14DRAFT_1817058 [Spinellus fusiger]
MRTGDIVYGQESNMLDQVGIDLQLPLHLCNPARGRLPCLLVHNGVPYGCEVNTLIKFMTAFRKTYPLYFIVHVLLPWTSRHLRKTPVQTLVRGVVGSVRSSVFLASLVAILMYTICVIRTRIGYQILHLPQSTLDHPLPIAFACAMSGLSILIESKPRRAEMVLYVAPRALHSALDRYLNGSKLNPLLETLVCSVSMTVLLEAIEKGQNIRSSTKGFLNWILQKEKTEKSI